MDQILRDLERSYGNQWPRYVLTELLNSHLAANNSLQLGEGARRYDLLRAWCEETMRYGVALRRALDETMQQ
jgi:hypothetical protein